MLAQISGSPAPVVTRNGDEMIERAHMRNAVDVSIRQFGCAHYAVEYTFVLKGQSVKAHDASGWLMRGADLIDQLQVVDSEAAVVRATSAALRAAAAEPYTFGDAVKVLEVGTVSVQADQEEGSVNLRATFDVAL
jgi:hypothetical protein